MVRYENGKDNPPNFQAGIDLLQQFSKIKGYSIPIYIYCGDTKKAQAAAKRREMNQSQIKKITAVSS